MPRIGELLQPAQHPLQLVRLPLSGLNFLAADAESCLRDLQSLLASDPGLPAGGKIAVDDSS